MRERLLNVIHFSFGILSIALSITIFGLDMAMVFNLAYSGSIAFQSYNTFISFTSIYSAIVALSTFYIIGIVISIFSGLTDRKVTLLVSSCIIILLNIPREGLAYKFFICFNYTYYQIVQARACLTFISVIVIIIIHIEIMLYKDADTEKLFRIGKIFLFIASFLALIGIAILNIFTLINLNTEFKKDINPKTVNIGYFTQSEIAQIEQSSFVKDSNYNSRIMSNLYDLIYSSDKKIAYRTCSNTRRGRCTNYYLRTLNVEIVCDSETEKFYSDCRTAQKLIIQMKHLDDGRYPIYNCAIVDKNATCRLGCAGLLNYNLFLVQEFDNKVELGWNGFCNCGVKSPKTKIAQDIGLNICDNKGYNLRNNYLVCALLILLSSLKFLLNV